LIFNFELVHVPGLKRKGPDGLSRRRVAKSKEGEMVEEAEEWVDKMISCRIWVASWLEGGGKTLVLAVGKKKSRQRGRHLREKGGGKWTG